MTISASMVKDLRVRTGAGMMECKRALTEVEGDIDAAIELLRKKGQQAQTRKQEGLQQKGLFLPPSVMTERRPLLWK